MAGSIFDLPENRDGSLENLGIPSNKNRNNQTTETDFDVYYDLSKSVYTSDALNKVFAYRAQRDDFEFQNTYNKTLQAMVNDKMLVSIDVNKQLADTIAKAHDKNTDLMICGKLGINPPQIIVACESEDIGVMLKIGTPEGKTYVTINREYVGGNIKNVVKGLYIDGKNILHLETTLRNSPVIKDVLDNMIRHNDIFDGANNITEKHIHYIMNKVDTRLDKHIKNNSIHVTFEDKVRWEGKYDKPKDGIPFDDLNSNTKNDIINSVIHSLDTSKHVSYTDRKYWDNKFDFPMSGLNESHFSLSLQEKIRNIFSLYDIIDPDTGFIRDDLLKQFDHSYLLDKSEFYDFLQNDWTDHKNDNIIHISNTERNAWNKKYTKPIGGIPEGDLSDAVRDKLNRSIKRDELLDNNGIIKEEYIPFIGDIESIRIHLNNTKVHLTPTEKQYLGFLGDPSLLKTKSKTIVGAINEIFDMLNNKTHLVTK